MKKLLAVLLAAVLPVFSGVYENLTGGVASSSFAYIQVSQIVGWVALAVTLVLGISLLVGAGLSRSPKGRDILSRFFENADKNVFYACTGCSANRNPAYMCRLLCSV